MRRCAGLTLPAGTRFVAGLLHEGRSPTGLRSVPGLVDAAVGHLEPTNGLVSGLVMALRATLTSSVVEHGRSTQRASP